jgi:hypothetical protein
MSANGELEGRDSTSAWPYVVGDTPGLGGIIWVFVVRFLADREDVDDSLVCAVLVDIEIDSPTTWFAFQKPNNIVLLDY